MFAGDWQDADQVTAFVAFLDKQQAPGMHVELSRDLSDWQFLAVGRVLYAGPALCRELMTTVQPLHLCN